MKPSYGSNNPYEEEDEREKHHLPGIIIRWENILLLNFHL